MNNKQVVEVVGVVAVVASLLFVGLQLIFDRRVAIAGQHHNRAQILIERNMIQFENDDYVNTTAALWESGQYPTWWSNEIDNWLIQNNVPMAYAAREALIGRIDAQIIDNNLFQYEQGLVDESSWSAMQEGARGTLNLSIIRRKAILGAVNLRPQTKSLISQYIEEINSESENTN